ncbi:hypothetical protein ACTJJ0_11555 [Chitinophaga sp. 22321]|uniref:Uncharacterized protein n=1 Tax=Chitinophaga hostae TaxID=2831022 RepID=A0ABS5IW70_9BACT|nr:hypothetical protein [Chitinophaga hostae]MBS0027166.1 hypothetical protein [Chitinophaga hostae]
MKSTTFHQAYTRLFALIMLCFTAFGFTNYVGLDSYEIYLNNKLVLKQSVNQPLNLRVLQLGSAAPTDLLRITYKHCHTPNTGTDRSIVVQDENGNTLKKWTFANAHDTDVSMTIPVKELLRLEKDHAARDLSLHYASRELPKGETLAFLKVK